MSLEKILDDYKLVNIRARILAAWRFSFTRK